MNVENLQIGNSSTIYTAGTGWIGQEGDRKRKEQELLRKTNQGSGGGPDPGSSPPQNQKYVYIGIGAGLVVGASLGLWLGLSIDLLKPIFWIFLMAICVAAAGGIAGNYFKKKADRKHLPEAGTRGGN